MAKLFIKQAEQYAAGRPNYPIKLFEFIASKTPCHDLAWDVGAGSGQASRSVTMICNFYITYKVHVTLKFLIQNSISCLGLINF